MLSNGIILPIIMPFIVIIVPIIMPIVVFCHAYTKLKKFSNVLFCRLLLAALHYNHNANRETARRSDGTEKYCVRYPRFRKGAHVVLPIKEAASYGKQCHAVLSYFEMVHETSVISGNDLYTVLLLLCLQVMQHH